VMGHLDTHGVLPAMYAPSWFLSLFAYTMPLSFVLRAMDVITAERAPESIIRIGITLLQRNADKLLARDDFESVMHVLNAGLYDDEGCARDRPGLVLQEAARLESVVTAARMEALEAQYYREQGAAPRASQSASVDMPSARRWAPTASQAAAIKFLGWPWSKDAAAAGTTPATTPTPRQSTAGSRSQLGSTAPATRRSSTSDSGTLSPRVLEMTQAQKDHSQQLREQMLRSLQTQADAPATALGPPAPADAASEVKQRRHDAPHPLSPSSSSSSSSLEAPSPAVLGVLVQRRCSTTNDSSWQAEVLEPLQRQLHDARVTSESRRDALAALHVDHEALRAELVVAKIERAGLAEENEQLRMRLRRAEAETARTQRAAGEAAVQQREAEAALVRTRVELVEAEEERALLTHQLSNLRAFIAESGSPAGGDAAVAPPQGEREDGVVARAQPADCSEPALAEPPRSNRFSISSIASNWSALREAIVSPRQQPPQQLLPAMPSLSLQGPLSPGADGGMPPRRSSVAVFHSATAPVSAVASPPPERASSSARHPGAIPLAMLHRSKTIAAAPTTAAAPRQDAADAD
ncbi:hypothetical protein IWQ56_002767, partial [Coemansia nantahalensis]